MKLSRKTMKFIAILGVVLITMPELSAQTKKLKRPRNRVGIAKVDNFVMRSFNIYDKVYYYDSYAEAGKQIDDDGLETMIDLVAEVNELIIETPGVLASVDGEGALKQGKAVLQINRAKKALKYCLKVGKELITGKKNNDESDTKNTEESIENNNSSNNTGQEVNNSNISDNLEVYSKYDFVPGTEQLFFDDFSNDFVGDLPSRWNTNGSGAIVKFNKVEGNWFELKSGYRLFVIPDINELPEDYTIEFDLLTSGITSNTSSSARLFFILSDTDTFVKGKKHYASISLPLGQRLAFKINTYNFFDVNAGLINSALTADIRDEIKNQPHIAISVTKKRYRLWVNEVKYVDIPRFIEQLDVLNYLKFHVYGLKDGVEKVFIKNLKVAKGGVDLRRKLISEGKISTNGILFDSGSANIQPQSYGIIRQISQVLLQESEMKLNIIGHTDADGTDETNLTLSKKRAEAIKNALINIYKISANRLQTDGKGESIPIGDNNTTEGKAQNRRVEFIKM